MLLAVREEIICSTILIFITTYYIFNKEKDKNNHFLNIMIVSIAHVLLDLITVITVNNRDIVPDLLNRILHIAYYMTGIIFGRNFYRYVLNISGLYKKRWLYRLRSNIPVYLFAALLIFMPMEYVRGNGTDYSYGPLTIIGYGLFIIYCFICIFMLLFYHKNFERRVRQALLPMTILMIIAVVMQAFIPEMLMTGGGLTFVCIGMFISLDNPDINFRHHALWDFLTGLKNQNSYKKDLSLHKNRSKFNKKQQQITFVVADVNNLKTINDNYGHDEGDRLITTAAKQLKENMKNAHDIYRLGGDEFVAIYINVNNKIIEQEIEIIQKHCSEDKSFPVPFNIAMGYASGVLNDEVNEIFKLADQEMYKNKNYIKEIMKGGH